MAKLSKADLLSYDEYKKLHDKFLKEVINEKKKRRVQISDLISGLFESKLTVFYQIQEMIRAEQITKDEYIDEMLEVYNDLLPEENELSMTLFIEIPNQEQLRKFNKTIIGIENHVTLRFGEHTITSYEPDQEEDKDENYTQSVHYLHFPFDSTRKQDFTDYKGDVYLSIEHPNYKESIKLTPDLIEELKKQLNQN